MSYLCNSVLGKVALEDLGIVLPHEHVCCYFEYFEKMCGTGYLDKQVLEEKAAADLADLKARFGLQTIIDCTPINIGRDLELLKRVSRKSGVHIISSTGFYYTEESMLADIEEDYIVQRILEDVGAHQIGHLKYAVEQETMSPLQEKLLRAMCRVQLQTGLPLCVHTNGRKKNGRKVLDFVLDCGVKPQAVTIAHLSDCSDLSFVETILESGCYAGFDRIYKNDYAFAQQKAADLKCLCEKGYLKQLLISHDALEFNGFHTTAAIREDNPYDFIFMYLLPCMREKGFTEEEIHTIMVDNPARMLTAEV